MISIFSPSYAHKSSSLDFLICQTIKGKIAEFMCFVAFSNIVNIILSVHMAHQMEDDEGELRSECHKSWNIVANVS